MRTHHRLIGLATAALFVVSAGSAQAQGKGHDKNKSKDKHEATEHVQKNEEHRESEARHRVTDAGHHVNDGHQHVMDDRRGVDNRRIPPGLAKKPGGMPPGQYKKRYDTDRGVVELRDVFGRHGYTVLRSEHSGDNRYVYYRASDGTTRRAIVRPGSDRLQFTNVPASLVQEVLARLY